MRSRWCRTLLLLAALLPFTARGNEGVVEPPPPEPENPCNAADPGYGVYEPWKETLPMGKILMPTRGGLTAKNEFDVIIHFHGSKALRKELVKTARGVFVVGIELGVGSGAYQRAFSDPEVFPQLLAGIEAAVVEHTQTPGAHIRKIALSGWSAGYGAIRAILRQPVADRIDSVILIDGLHTDYDEADPTQLVADQINPFVRFAQHAAKKQRFMFVSHSKIIPPGYASTTETSHYLVERVGGRVTASLANDSTYLSRYEQAQKGNFLMRGYLGESKYDHCAELGVMTEVVAALEKRWKTPAGKGNGTVVQ